MGYFPYVIIGGGMTGAAAANGIRELDPDGAIALISAESDRPYDRPPLSKKLWDGKKKLEEIFVPLPKGVDMRLGRRVVELDAGNRTVTDDEGETYAYGQLLLATGGTPRKLPYGGDAVNYYRTLEDYRLLCHEAEAGAKFVVIGGGFIGSEVAAALRKQGNEVTIIFPQSAICERVFPPPMAAYLNDYYLAHGVEVLARESVTNIEDEAGRATVITESGRRLPVDRVVAGIGIVPDVELAQRAGLAVDNGITVDAYLRTGRKEIFAAGDVANYPDAILGLRRRVEHADAARAMGQAAGHNMAGADRRYAYLPMFYSDLFSHGYEAVGVVDTRLEIVEDWHEEPYRQGVLYYLQDQRVRGVLTWNIWDKLDEARALIEGGEVVSPESLAGRIRADH